jgi:GMP synthase (glutamine-hydrolysing)
VTIEDGATPLFAGLPLTLQVWMSHGDEALELPAGFSPHRRHVQRAGRNRQRTAPHLGGAVSSRSASHAARSATDRNFVFNICGAAATGRRRTLFRPRSGIREKVGSGHVICGLSGGVDSSVAAVLVHKAIGSQLTCIFVNNGVLRKNEFVSVQKNLRDKLGLNIVAVDASERFLTQLAGVTDPETKRKRIGAEFIAVFDDEATRIAKKPAVWIGWCRERSIPT